MAVSALTASLFSSHCTANSAAIPANRRSNFARPDCAHEIRVLAISSLPGHWALRHIAAARTFLLLILPKRSGNCTLGHIAGRRENAASRSACAARSGEEGCRGRGGRQAKAARSAEEPPLTLVAFDAEPGGVAYFIGPPSRRRFICSAVAVVCVPASRATGCPRCCWTGGRTASWRYPGLSAGARYRERRREI